MKLSDVMSAMDLAQYAAIALVIFFAVFVLVVARVMRRELQEEWKRAGRLPLDELPRSFVPRGRGGADG
jgi:hypothetical protein